VVRHSTARLESMVTRREPSNFPDDWARFENQKAALRTDRREPIYNFIQAIEKARAVTAKFPVFGPKGEPKGILDELHVLSTEMWARRGCLDVIYRPALSVAATEYAQKVKAIAMMSIF
jgi:hypothetical protein